MKLIRPIVQSDALRVVMCWLGSMYVRIVFATSRFQVVNGHIPAAYWDAGKPFIMCMWHGRMLMLPFAWSKTKKLYMLRSAHRDGQIVSRMVGHFGIGTVAGSSSSGGTRALREMLARLKGGEWIGITPDGPRGPRMRATDGVLALARLSGVPVIPLAMNSSPRKVVRSWDRFIVSLPFTRGVFMWGEPIDVPSGANKEELNAIRLQIEQTLNQLCHETDDMFDQERIEPHSDEATP